MAPKKNAFSAFIHQHQEMINGKQTPSFQELSNQLRDKWNSMSVDEKNNYKILADKLNQNRNKKDHHPEVKHQIRHINNLLDGSSDFWTMKNDLKKKFDSINTNEELMNQKFILLHINCHSHVEEQYYFPAEIAALEFCLKDGVTRRYHQFIGISNIYPRGYAGSMREYSEKFHQIHCWDEHWDDYESILLDLVNFLKDESEDNINVYDGKFDLPYMFTIQNEIGNDMMKMKKSLETLYTTVLPDYSKQVKTVFKIGSVEELFSQIIKKMKIHLDPRRLNSNEYSDISIHNILEADMYGRGLGCVYHHIRDIEYKCSRARVLQWLSNICKYIGDFSDLEVQPGRHVAALLRDGSRRVFDTGNENVPITAYDLIIDKINSSQDYHNVFDNDSLESSTILDESEDINEDYSSDDY